MKVTRLSEKAFDDLGLRDIARKRSNRGLRRISYYCYTGRDLTQTKSEQTYLPGPEGRKSYNVK